MIDFDTYKDMNTDYIIGLPSGQIIDINKKYINGLKQAGHINYMEKYNSFVFPDSDYDKIFQFLISQTDYKSSNCNVFDDSFMVDITNFFDYQRNVRQYFLNRDGSVDVSGNVYVSGAKFTEIPILFNKVSGDFIFRNCGLNSLKNCPIEVGGHFDVSGNNLENLMNGPRYVGGMYNCSNNLITSLEGSPDMIRGDFDCSDNFLSDLSYCPGRIKGTLDCSNNPIQNLNDAPKCHIVGNKRQRNVIKLRDEGDGRRRW